MFAVIGARFCGTEGFRGRLAGFFNPFYGIRLEPVKRYGMRIIESVVELPDPVGGKKSLKRASAALKCIAESGIKTAVPSEDFPYTEMLSHYSLSLPDRLRLLRQSAGKMAVLALGADPALKTAALYAKRLSPDYDEAVRYLLPRTRNLAVYCGGRRDEYAAGLLREFGVSVLTNRKASENADVHLLFDDPGDELSPRPDSAALVLYKGKPSLACRSYADAEFEWPARLEDIPGYPKRDLVAALFECGAVSIQELNVKLLI